MRSGAHMVGNETKGRPARNVGGRR
jgi:hypothetical protein